jgi:hypothetical protein
MAEPSDMILPLLREMRAEIAIGFSESSAEHARMSARLEKMEGPLTSFRQVFTADTLMSKLLTGEFEERIEALEQRVRELEGQK